MKKFKELSEKELRELTQKQVDFYIKLEKANLGVRFMQKPEPITLEDVEEKDIVVYKIPLLGDGCVFLNLDVASSIAKDLSNSDIVEVSSSYSDIREISDAGKYLEDNKFGVVPIKCYSKDLARKIRDIVKSNNKLKSEYNADLKEHDNYIEENKDISETIYKVIREAKDKQFEKDSKLDLFRNTYLELANGDEIVAMNFLCKAYSVSDELKEYILTNIKEKSDENK